MADASDPNRPPPWDTAAMETLRCDVANAAVQGDEVMVHFGRREAGEGGELGVRHLRALRLTPYAAKRLQELLAVLVRDHDRRRGNGG